ncbi:SDR family oxidoreductase [Pedobacter cryophilus]|uniref:SDR family oxidoreductase n=1 Tax=Pedobacter cryophilus TaxID=2571271 RepID=A0A4U1C189_9SPHI|nr:SDR family oxidoreductase [Pedobacter cryophilus]TKB97860.1 SDR family oxidoreductase [Pedobacter cryophilus]
MDLKDKVVVITGASSGIGRACAIEFAKRGAHLVLAARQYVKLCEITQEIHEKYKVKTLAVQTDVSKEQDCKELIAQTISTMGRIDILINNAGISMRALFKDLDLEVLKQVMDINFWGTVYCTKYALQEILNNEGSIVGVSSIAGFKGLPGRTGYSASKFAMNGFLEALRTENLKNNLHVMLACPGFTASNIRNVALNSEAKSQGESSMEEDKMMTAAEVAIRIVDGVEQRKRQLIMTGQGKLTVLMQKFFPKWLDHLVYNHFKKEKDPLI